MCIAVDSSGYVYVGDWNSRIQKFDGSGKFIAQWGTYGIGNGQFGVPGDIAVDSSGNVYVGDVSRIEKFDSNGNYLAQWGSFGSDNGQFEDTSGVAVDSSGNVYVAEGWNNRIQKFDSNGKFLDNWGSKGSGNGQFSSLNDVAVDSLGNVYVADRGNDCIEKFAINDNATIKDVPQSPVASFTSSVRFGTAPLKVFFYDTSTGTPTSWSWDFGDRVTSTDQNPTHTYAEAGNYQVSLTVSNETGRNTKSNYYVDVADEQTQSSETQSEPTTDEEQPIPVEQPTETGYPGIPSLLPPLEQLIPVEQPTETEQSLPTKTPTPSTNITPLSGDAAAFLKKYEQEAKFSFNPTEKMKVGETEIVNAYITTNISKNISQEYGLDESLLQSKNITITPRVRVTLAGESGAFDIETIPLNSDGVQPIIAENTTMWSWQVTPLEPGNHTLFISVEYVIPLNDHDYQNFKTLNDTKEVINVEAKYDSWTFFSVLIGAIFLAFGILKKLGLVKKPSLEKTLIKFYNDHSTAIIDTVAGGLILAIIVKLLGLV